MYRPKNIDRKSMSPTGQPSCARMVPGSWYEGVWANRTRRNRAPGGAPGASSWCERYAEEAGRALANCHSGAMDHPRLLAACKEVEPDDGCFERLEGLACEVVEKNPYVVIDVCRKKP